MRRILALLALLSGMMAAVVVGLQQDQYGLNVTLALLALAEALIGVMVLRVLIKTN